MSESVASTSVQRDGLDPANVRVGKQHIHPLCPLRTRSYHDRSAILR